MKTPFTQLSALVCLLLFWVVSCKKEDTPVTPVVTPPGSGTTVTPTKSSAKAITAFAFGALNPAVTGTVDATAKTISATVASGTDVTKLVPTITVSDKATVSPASGVAQDFSKAVTYTVTAEDGTTQAYTVTVNSPVTTGNTFTSNSVIYAIRANYDHIVKNPGSSDSHESTSHIVAIDPATGKELAIFEDDNKYILPNYLFPVIYYNGSLVLTGSNVSDKIIDAGNGRQKVLLGKDLIARSVVVDNNILYGTTVSSNNIYAIDMATGKNKYSISVGRPVNTGTVVDGLWYVAYNGGLICYDINTQAKKWEFTGQNVANNPAVVNGLVYFGASDVVYALDAKTGVKKWEYSTGGTSPFKGITSHITIADGLVYVGALNKSIYALDAQTGTVKWQVITDGAIDNSDITVGSGLVYFTNNESKSFALNSKTGVQKWVLSGAITKPVFVNETIYCNNKNGNLTAIDTSTGNTKWELKGTYLGTSTPLTNLGTYGYNTFGQFCVVIDGKMYSPSSSGMQQ